MKYRKDQLINGVLWSGIDKLGVVVVQILLEIILARHLLPRDYGIIGMASIFIVLGSLFSESGFSNALIQKQDRNEVDFSTAFYFNVLVAVAFVVVVFFSAPLAADFFVTPVLTDVLRVVSLSVVFNALVMVHKTKLSIALDFKTQAKISFISLFLSGLVGIYLAVSGFGVWALVTQVLAQSVLIAVLFYTLTKWWPLLIFSRRALATLFQFGSKVLLAGLVQSIYSNLYNLFIGRQMSASSLGIYTKSNQFTFMPASLISGILQRVMFPYFSSFQGDDAKIFQLNQKFTQVICIAIFPIFMYLALFSKPLVFYGLSENWMDAADIISILAIAMILFPITVNNMILFQVKNKPSLYLRLEIVSKIIGCVILFLTVNYGLKAICYGLLLQQLIQFIITSVYTNLLIHQKLLSQILLVLPYAICAVVISAAVIYVESKFHSNYLNFLGIGTLVFFIFYSVLYGLFMRGTIVSLINMIKMK